MVPDLHYHRSGGPVKIRLIKETPQNDASSPAPVSPADLAAPFKRAKRSWDEELAKFNLADKTPATEKDSEDN